MKAICDEIEELRMVTVDVDKTFVYFDKLDNGSWRCVMTKDMKDKFKIVEKNEENALQTE
jgi:hypothetical protein